MKEKNCIFFFTLNVCKFIHFIILHFSIVMYIRKHIFNLTYTIVKGIFYEQAFGVFLKRIYDGIVFDKKYTEILVPLHIRKLDVS